jgi:hypothetical protein
MATTFGALHEEVEVLVAGLEDGGGASRGLPQGVADHVLELRDGAAMLALRAKHVQLLYQGTARDATAAAKLQKARPTEEQKAKFAEARGVILAASEVTHLLRVLRGGLERVGLSGFVLLIWQGGGAAAAEVPCGAGADRGVEGGADGVQVRLCVARQEPLLLVERPGAWSGRLAPMPSPRLTVVRVYTGSSRGANSQGHEEPLLSQSHGPHRGRNWVRQKRAAAPARENQVRAAVWGLVG